MAYAPAVSRKRDRMKRNKKRITAAVLAALMILIVLLFAGAVVLEATHDCNGVDCRICDMIHTLGSMLRSWAAIAVILLFAVSVHPRGVRPNMITRCFFRATPVTDKVVMLN